MFNVMVSFGQSQWQFLFKDQDSAVAILEKYEKAISDYSLLHIADHFGNQASVKAGEIKAILIEDYSKTIEAAIERSITQARAQARAQQKAQNDPLLRMSAMAGGMPNGGGMPFGPMMRS